MGFFLGGPVPPLYVSFPGVGAWVRGCVGAWVRGYVGAWVRGRKLLEAELTMTMKIKVINLDENIPKRCFGYLWDPSRT